MTVFCERDTTRDGNHCIKCGGEWVAGTPLPVCGAVMGTGYGLAAFKDAAPQPPLVEPLRCFPKFGGPFDLHTNPPSDKKYEICDRCGNSWTHNSVPPLCPRDGVMATLLPFDGRTYTKDEIIEADGTVQSWEIPSAILLDPVVRDLARDEPFFVLRGSDLLADYLVEQWAKNAESNGCDPKRVRAAREKAQEFRAFSPRGYPV